MSILLPSLQGVDIPSKTVGGVNDPKNAPATPVPTMKSENSSSTAAPNVVEISASSGSEKSSPNRISPSIGSRRKRKRKNTSAAWLHFKKDPARSTPESKVAVCNYCSRDILYTSGTSAMLTHLKRCEESPKSQKKKIRDFFLNGFQQEDNTVNSGLSVLPPLHPNLGIKFDQDACRKELVRMFVAAELSFNFVENEAFRRFLRRVQPKFVVHSRKTLCRDIFGMFDEEKEKLKGFMARSSSRVCLTTDTWTSNQNLNYLCLTAHFIDDGWNLHKRIINFVQLSSHSGDLMGRTIEDCLKTWEIKKVLTVTVDNASSNNTLLYFLKKCFMSWDPSFVLRGEYAQMRCCAHILNLIVKDGLKEIADNISRIRAAVKYVRSSPARYSRFKALVASENIKCERLVVLDVETRWNSTYLMLDVAVKFEQVFYQLEGAEDEKYTEELNKGSGVPTEEDWEYARSILPFLKAFYNATNRISGSYYATANLYMIEVSKIHVLITRNLTNPDSGIREMAYKMQMKFNKYWGDPKKVNMLLMIAVILDPRQKMGGAKFIFENFFGAGTGVYSEMVKKLEDCLKTIFEQYKTLVKGVEQHVAATDTPMLNIYEDDDAAYWAASGNTTQPITMTELDRYLAEAREPYDATKPTFDVLNWWKVSSARFPILGSIAREILAIPISTVASESAFSTGGRVIDDYRSRLTPKMVEALICTQDWVRGTAFTMQHEEDFEELEKFEIDIDGQEDDRAAQVLGSINP